MPIKYKNDFLSVDKETNSFIVLSYNGEIKSRQQFDKLNFPCFLDGNGKHIAVSNTWDSSVLIFDYDLQFLNRLNFQFAEPVFVKYHKENLFVCDRELHKVFVFDSDYNLIKSFPSNDNTLNLYGEVQLFMPTSIAISDDILYISQINNLIGLNYSGDFLFYKKNGKVFEQIQIFNDNLYILNQLEYKIDVYGKTGIYLTSFDFPRKNTVQEFIVLDDKILLFSLFFENMFEISINEIPSEKTALFKHCQTPLEIMTVADLLIKNGEFEKGLEYFEKLLQQYPGFPPAMDRLEKLKNSISE
jgi:tetratricopeptide (TPR) repeat protein